MRGGRVGRGVKQIEMKFRLASFMSFDMPHRKRRKSLRR
jgi:hypothetical protein